MRKKNQYLKRIKYFIKKSFKQIQLRDKCLILFMALLLFECIFNLFSQMPSTPANIDTLIRTTIASIFGYFLSANFIKKCNIDRYKNPLNGKTNEELGNINLEKKCCTLSDNSNKNDKEDTEYVDEEEDDDCLEEISKQQMIIVAMIGVISLIAIIAYRNLGFDVDTNSNATLSQLRDFVSGSVGFLIGCESKKNK